MSTSRIARLNVLHLLRRNLILILMVRRVQTCDDKFCSTSGSHADFVYLMLILCKGAVSSLDSEHVCPSSQHVTPTTDASSGEGQLLSAYYASVSCWYLLYVDFNDFNFYVVCCLVILVSACICSSGTCSVLFVIIYKFLVFFWLASICLLFVGLHLHGFGLIILFLQSYNCLVLFFCCLLSWVFCFQSLFTDFDGWIAFSQFLINHIIVLEIQYFGFAFLLFADLPILFLS